MARKSKMTLEAEEICAGIPQPKRDFAVELVLDLMFLRKKLAECRKQANTAPPVSDYDNGGGQTGVRVDPWVQAHKSLAGDYRAALKQLTELLDGVNDEKAASSLAAFRSISLIAGQGNRKSA